MKRHTVMFSAMLGASVILGSLGCTQQGTNAEAKPGATAQASAPEAKSVESVFTIGGMTCVSCANTIRDAVTKQPGVQNAIVMYADEELRVTWSPDATPDQDAVMKAVRDAGYTIEPSSGS